MKNPCLFRGLIPLASLFLLVFSTYSCRSLRIDPEKKIALVVRESHTSTLLDQVQINLIGPDANSPIVLPPTDPLGYTEIVWKDVKKQLASPNLFKRTDYQLVYQRNFKDHQGSYTQADTLRLNNYLGFIDLYLENKRQQGIAHTFTHVKPVADMHYHVSMRTHNLFGYELYFSSDSAAEVPDNLNLFKSHPNLEVLYKGKWKTPYLNKIKFDKVGKNGLWTKRHDKMKTLLNTQWVRPKSKYGVNHFKEYTQATHPHLVEGGVYLAYNAISPLEHNASNTKEKRFANRTFATKASKKWLQQIGEKTSNFTHWRNFNKEYQTIISQHGYYDHYGWRFMDENVDLYDNLPTIINVVEGAHILQDELFPHVLPYNLANRTPNDSWHLFNDIIEKRVFDVGQPLRNSYELLIDSIRAECQLAISAGVEAEKARNIADILQKLKVSVPEKIDKPSWKNIGLEAQAGINKYIDQLLIEELTTNIDSLKRLSGPPIAMVTIAHLTYNGMVGHATGLNGGGFLTKIFARKNYSIRVSDDPTYKKQWASAFFTIPGVNKFGKAVLKGLLSTDNGQHRILVDLKHSDFFTRKYFFDELMLDPDTQDTIPPICSHCGVTGLPNPYYSPLTDEFSLLQSPATTTFYPFGINIYDDEIEIICRNDGIIGIPLFQQMLGGNIDRKQNRDYKIKKNGEKLKDKPSRIGRHKEIERFFRYYIKERDPDVAAALAYTDTVMGVPANSKHKFARTVEDYISAEPFIQNLFYIIDHAGIDQQAAWSRVCIGSDLDGLIDPIDICPTATLYPNFRERLRQFIPIFLKIREERAAKGNGKVGIYTDYFSSDFSIDHALELLFYESLRAFSAKHLFKKSDKIVKAKTH